MSNGQIGERIESTGLLALTAGMWVVQCDANGNYVAVRTDPKFTFVPLEAFMPTPPKVEAAPKRERHVWGIDRRCMSCGVDRLGPQASGDCSGVDLSLAAP